MLEVCENNYADLIICSNMYGLLILNCQLLAINTIEQ